MDPGKCARRTYHLLGSLWGKADTGLKPIIEKFQRHAHLSDSVLAANGSTFPVAVQAHPVNTHYCRAREKHAVLYFYIGGTLLRLYAFAKKQSRENQDNFERWFARLRIVIRQWPTVVVYGSDPEGYRLLTEERAVQLLRNRDDADFKNKYTDED